MQLLLPTLSRHVLLVLGDPAGAAALANSEIVRCPSVTSAVSALGSGRRYSAVLSREMDQVLETAAQAAAVPVITVSSEASTTDLARLLATHASPVPIVDRPLMLGPAGQEVPPPATPRGRLVAVCGPGGTGASVVAAALAGIAATAATRPQVLLADLARHADQAFLHGLSDRAGSLLGLVDAARYRPIMPADVRRHTVAGPGYRLLPGLRRASHWTAVVPTAFDPVLMAMLETADLVIADVTGDVEGENETGSIDVEERNYMARRTTTAADAVVVVGAPGANGDRRAVRLTAELVDHGVSEERIVPAVSRSIADEVRAITIEAAVVSPRGLLPTAAVAPLAVALSALLERLPPADRTPALVPVAPGSLGCRTL